MDSSITLDLPFPPSTNRIWRSAHKHVYRSQIYVKWLRQADALVLANRQYPRKQITGAFTVEIELARIRRGDGDNRIKAVLDYLQSREIVRNDSDCDGGSWKWVNPLEAPFGCRVHVRSIAPIAAGRGPVACEFLEPVGE